MAPVTHSIQIVAAIPTSLPPELIIEMLQDHSNVMTLQKLTTSFTPLPNTSPHILEDPYFSPPTTSTSTSASISTSTSTSPSNISSYSVTEGVVLIPSLWTYPITFPANFQNTPKGTKSRADASGVIVRGEFHVERASPDFEVDGEGEGVGIIEWVLVETASVECAGWMMPFVRRSFEGAHRGICRQIVEKAQRKHDLSEGRSVKVEIQGKLQKRAI